MLAAACAVTMDKLLLFFFLGVSLPKLQSTGENI